MKSPRPRPVLRTRRAFTLLEIALALVILGILVTLAIPTYNSVINNAHSAVAHANAFSIVDDAVTLGADKGTAPSQADFLSAAAETNTTTLSGYSDSAGTSKATFSIDVSGSVETVCVATADTVNATPYLCDPTFSRPTPTPGAPGAPGTLSAVSDSTGEASLAWNPPTDPGSSPITGYSLQYSSDGGTTWTTISDSATSPTADADLTNGTSYLFAVAAINSSGTGLYSSVSPLTTPSLPLAASSATYDTGTNPLGLYSNGRDVFIANNADNTLTELNATTGDPVRTLTGLDAPEGAYATSADVWVTNSANNTVSEFDATTGALVHTIGVGTNPVAITGDGAFIWVADDTSPGDITKINESTGAVLASYSTGLPDNTDALASNGNVVYVAGDNATSDDVVALNVISGAVVTTTALGAEHNQTSMALADGYLYVANSVSKTLSMLSATTGALISTISLPDAPSQMAADSANVWVSAPSSNAIFEVDAPTGTLVRTVSVGSGPYGVTQDQGYVWSADSGVNKVSTITR